MGPWDDRCAKVLSIRVESAADLYHQLQLAHGYYNKLGLFHYPEQYISDETVYTGAASTP